MSSKRNGVRTSQQFVPVVEWLEDRTVPAGNVQVAVIGHTLTIIGDDAANAVWIAGNTSTGAVVRPWDKTTTLNGQSGPLFERGVKDIVVKLNGGDDQLVVSTIRNRGDLSVDLGDGNNTFTEIDGGNRGATYLRSGSGSDTFTLAGSMFRGPVMINTGAGDDQINALAISVLDLTMINPAGNDFFNNQGSTIIHTHMIGTFTPGTLPTPPASPPASPPPSPSAAPSVQLSTTATDPTNANPITFNARFSSAVTGFSGTGVQVTNGAVTSFTQQDAQTYTFQVTPTNQGAVTATVLAGAADDASGNANTTSNTVSVTFDSVAPALTITPQTTNKSTPTITGTVSKPNSTVNVTVNGQSFAATVTGTTWAAAVTSALADGTYSVTASAIDTAGNTGSTTSPSGLTVDTVAPTAPTLNLAPASDSGTVGDLRTDQSSVALTGTAEAGSTVTLTHTSAPNAPGTGPVIAQTTAAANGTFTFSNVALAVGPNSFVARASDAAGNVGPTFAQTFTRTVPPTVATPIPDQTLTANGASQTFDLSTVFATAQRVVRMTVSYPTGQTGFIDINLFPNQAPKNVANFLAYLNSTDPTVNYNGTIFHRLAPGFVLQGGGFKYNASGTSTSTIFPPMTQMAAVASEPGVSNTLGTIAMAMTGSANSATNEFFFNLGDNSTNLDQQTGGFTVFGQVMNGGLQTLSAIGKLNTYNGSGLPGAGPFPVGPNANTTNFPTHITANDLAMVTTAAELTTAQKLAFNVVNVSNPAVVSASVTGSTLTITPKAAGTATVTVSATDLDGSTTNTTVHVTVV